MERQRFSFGMQFGLILRYFLRHAALVLLMALLLAGALYPLILIFRSQMDLGRKILSAVLELIFSGIILCTAYSKILEGFRSYPDFRIRLAKTTQNQKWLHEFVEKDDYELVRDTATARISNPDELLAIALQNASHIVRCTAAKHLQDSGKAETLVAYSKDSAVRAEAVHRVKNEDLLFEIALHDSDVAVRRNAASILRDPEKVETLISLSKDNSVRADAVHRARNEDFIFELALHDSDVEVRRNAASVLQEPKKVEKLIALSKDDSIRADAVLRVKNEDFLFELALHDSDVAVRRNAARKLKSTEHLLNLLTVTKDCEVWNICSPRLIQQVIHDGKLPTEIASKLRKAPLADDLLKQTVCPICFSSDSRSGWKSSEPELLYWASDNVVYGSNATSVVICNGCGHESDDEFYIPLTSLFPEETK